MADKKNLCAQIDIALHNRVTEEKDRLEMTTSQYIASLLTEYYKMKDENAGHLGWRSHDLRHHGKEAAGGSAADLDPERRAVVETACRLVGKVNYFWGGKSLVIGWDSRWGELRQVTAAGSSTTGTYRPYGLDCSGFVDWVFYNVTDGEYVIGHGGGAHMQHTYCTPISWNEAQPAIWCSIPMMSMWES